MTIYNTYRYAYINRRETLILWIKESEREQITYLIYFISDCGL